MLELGPHDLGAADVPSDRALVEDEPQVKRRILVQQPLPLHPKVHHPGDLFGAVARVHQSEAVICLVALLVKIDLHKAPADYHRQPGTEGSVADQAQGQP